MVKGNLKIKDEKIQITDLKCCLPEWSPVFGVKTEKLENEKRNDTVRRDINLKKDLIKNGLMLRCYNARSFLISASESF